MSASIAVSQFAVAGPVMAQPQQPPQQQPADPPPQQQQQPHPSDGGGRHSSDDAEAPTRSGGVVLDGFSIIETACARLPEEVHIVDLSGKDYDGFEESDLEFFTNLRLIDLGDNRLTSIAKLSRLQSLAELRVPANALSRIDLVPGSFSALKVLDASFNTLDAEAIVSLGALPQLAKLDISGNNIGFLPDLEFEFRALRVLVAEHNSIEADGLLALHHLPKLRELRLSGNPISHVPYECTKFVSLEMLDLSDCKIDRVEHIAPVQNFRMLQRIVLHGNPFTSLQRLSRYNLGQHQRAGEGLQVVTAAPSVAPWRARPSVAEAYDDVALRKAEERPPAAKLEAFDVLSLENLQSIFERIEDDLSWLREEASTSSAAPPVAEESTLASVGAGSATEADGEPSYSHTEAERSGLGSASGTFLTSLADDYSSRSAVAGGALEPEDATMRVAKAFGLDPRRMLSSDHLGLDATASINALKFALRNPLVDVHASGKVAHHQKMTASAEMRILSKAEGRRGSGGREAKGPKTSRRKEAIQDTLSRMKEKLATAKEKLASAVPAGG